MSLVTRDNTTFPKMSTAGYIQEGKYKRRHRAAFGILICVALTLFLLVVAAVTVFGWYLINNRDQDGVGGLFNKADDTDDKAFPTRYQPSFPDYGIDTNIYVDLPTSSTENYPAVTSATSSIINKQLTSNANNIDDNNRQTTTELPETPTTTPIPLSTTTAPSAVSDTELSELIQYFWDVTSHKQFIINRDYMLSFQGETNETGTQDLASKKFFSRVKGDIRGTSQIMRHFVRLLKSYTSRWYDPGKAEDDNSLEVARFLQYVSRSEALLELEQFLNTNGLLQTFTFPELIEAAWFYSQPDSSRSLNGFQRVFVGAETTAAEKDVTFVGLNNWIQFYLLEKEKTLNYQGYISKREPGLVRVRYSLDTLESSVTSSFFVGTPPDFELAVYSLCLVTRTNQNCRFKLQDHDVTVVVQATQNTDKRLVIMNAHPVL